MGRGRGAGPGARGAGGPLSSQEMFVGQLGETPPGDEAPCILPPGQRKWKIFTAKLGGSLAGPD